MWWILVAEKIGETTQSLNKFHHNLIFSRK